MRQEIERATLEVFASMAGVEVIPDRGPCQPHCENRSKLVSSLRLSGAVDGMAHVVYTLPIATSITCSMWEMAPPVDSRQVQDAIGEMANMIVGNIKSWLESQWGSICIGIPTVGGTVCQSSGGVSTRADFRCREETLTVMVSLQPAVEWQQA